MNRNEMIQILEEMAPCITEITETSDMGVEFSAVVHKGYIFSEPGMLLDYSDGEWPPTAWKDKTDEEFNRLLTEFVLDGLWRVTLWDELKDKEIEQCLEGAKNSKYRVGYRDLQTVNCDEYLSFRSRIEGTKSC